VVIDEENFKETEETVSEQIIEIMTMLTNREDRKKDIIMALKSIEVKTNDLFRKFEDAYKKKNDICKISRTSCVTLLNYMFM
jgi:hypothetical protein